MLIKSSSAYNFEGGEELKWMGASWFVSYYYHVALDKTHTNWQRVSSVKNRIYIFERNKNYFELWLGQIVKMSENKLDTNEIGLNGFHVKQMAQLLLQVIFNKSL